MDELREVYVRFVELEWNAYRGEDPPEYNVQLAYKNFIERFDIPGLAPKEYLEKSIRKYTDSLNWEATRRATREREQG